MARIRTIKPEFWTSEQVMNLTRDARLAFLGLLNFSDDGGNHPASPKTLKAQVFPGDDDLTTEGVLRLVQSIHEQRLVATYQGADGADYWHVTGWKRHQYIEKPTYRYPPFPDASPTPPQPFPDASPTARPRKGREGNGIGMETNGMEKKAEKHAQRAPRGTRLSTDWVPSDDLRAWAKTERPDIDTDRTAAEFVDYWVAKPGKEGLKLDWDRTFHNWVRNERGHYARNGHAGPATGETPYQRRMRERMQEFAPSVAAKAPGTRAVIDVEATDVSIPRRMG